ncbi:leucine-rich repeat-containing protein 74A-like [Pollicipes pollicipes]|uniref:leucine-rich repeat-containing protein 74A-like n=1 Tax=Pollicipes pollicipes TaxID=41117 RepID=UPI001884A4F1|nr:leucine-rich repeat-containing protein 74A-like [Pollicipes pollicipes]
MLVPIPEPDFSVLADREKLFPRPALSNPKVTYQLSCKQLGVVPISQYLRSLDTYAEDLRLQSYGLTRLDMLPLCHSLAYNTTATTLNLSNNRLEDDVLPNIEAMMNDNSFIGAINLSRNNLTGPGLDSLRVMLSNNYTLTSLDLSHCHLLDVDAPALAAVIEVSLNLRQLNLGYNELSECGKVLGTVLTADEGLETLDLSWNTFRARSARDLLMGLRANSRLRRLDLAWNSLGPDVARGLRDLLKKNTTLAELDVSHNRLRDPSMRPIAIGLRKNQTLEKIWLGHNPVTPVGALALMKVLPKASVGYVDLSQIEVSSDFVKMKEKLDQEAITVVHGTINKNMVLIAPPQKKGRGPPPPVIKKKK